MDALAHYRQAGPITTLAGAPAALLDGLPADPVALCAVAHGLVIQPADASRAGVAADRLAEKDVRPAADLLGVLGGLDPRPLTAPRPATARVVGTCRHFAVLATALLRHAGVPARARCGFGTYFQPGRGLDHWVLEYWNGDRFVRLDPETLGTDLVEAPEDLAPGLFLTGGEAWQRYRAGEIDAQHFGVPGYADNWGPAEIRGNAIRDLAALAGYEMLPWDEWGRMTASYAGETGPDYDELLDRVAVATADGDPAAVTACYRTADLAVPTGLRPA
jgi:hypothetical protein